MKAHPLTWSRILLALSLVTVTACAQLPEIQASEHQPVSEVQIIAPSPILQPGAVTPIDRIHIVKPGETLYRISRSYGVTIDQIRQWNHLPNDILEVEQKLIVRKSEPNDSQTPTGPTIFPTSAFNLAYNDYLNGKYDLAVAGFQRFVKDFPRTLLTPNAYYWLGESSYQQKDYVRALQSFEFLAVEYPGSEKVPSALFKSGLAAGETGDLVTSRKYLKRVIEEFPTSDEANLAKNQLALIR